MRRFIALLVVGAVPFAATVVGRAAATKPDWAYAIQPPPAPGAPVPAPDTAPKSVPGAAKQFTRQEIGNAFGPADWFPEDHPPMPDVVAKGKRPDARACALCHYPNGKGRMENAAVSSLPVAYFIQTMNDFRNDLRKTGEPKKANTNAMIQIAKALSPEEIKQAAEYFGSIKWTPYVKVVETDTVDKMESRAGIWVPITGAGAGKEPIGVRIIETPVSPEQTDLRNPRSTFTAYAPKGSIKKGEALVKTGGNGKTIECGVCHGQDLLGLGPVPGIAGRSPSYLVRQMYDMQVNARKGEWTQLMMPVVTKLSDEDLVNIGAYVASRPVGGTTATK